MSSSTSPTPTSSSNSASLNAPKQFKVVGILLAVASGILIGSSFVFKKKGLLRSQKGGVAGEGVAYLKSPLWWTGMSMMIVGEICNFVAYAFVEAIVVTPLGALSVVICAILSSIFLKEKLTFFGWLGCGLCIVGSTIIALNGPQEATVGEILAFQKLFLSPGFLVWGGLLISASAVIMLYFGPKYGKQSMLWYIFVCSMIGGLSVSCTTGLGASIVTSIQGQNQFRHWFIYFLLIFVSITLVTEVLYLNKALALFNTAMVTPTYYVIFTFFTLVTSVILFQGLKTSVTQILTIVCGFLTICVGITILQMSKVDPTHLSKLDRKSTILLQAARNETESAEKSISGLEDPGMDTLRGSFGAMGSIIRARSARRMSRSSTGGWTQRSHALTSANNSLYGPSGLGSHLPGIGKYERHQLYDPPVPTPREHSTDDLSLTGSSVGLSDPIRTAPRTPTIKFETQDLAHYYPRTGTAGGSKHEHVRAAVADGHQSLRPSRILSETLSPPPGPPVPSDLGDGQKTPRASEKRRSPRPMDHFEMAGLQASAKVPGTSNFSEPSLIERVQNTPSDPPSKHKTGRKKPQKRYPSTNDPDEGEERIALVNQGVSRTDSDSAGPSDSEITPVEPGIRLVSSRTFV